MPGAWDSRVVTTTAPLPDDLVLALLECGAKAVLCLAQHAVAVPTDVAITFFNALYHHFLHDVPLFQVSAPSINQSYKEGDLPNVDSREAVR